MLFNNMAQWINNAKKLRILESLYSNEVIRGTKLVVKMWVVLNLCFFQNCCFILTFKWSGNRESHPGLRNIEWHPKVDELRKVDETSEDFHFLVMWKSMPILRISNFYKTRRFDLTVFFNRILGVVSIPIRLNSRVFELWYDFIEIFVVLYFFLTVVSVSFRN